MPNQTRATLLESRVFQATAKNILKEELRHLFIDLRNKGRHSRDTSSLYSSCAAVCYDDSFLATGTFSQDKGILE